MVCAKEFGFSYKEITSKIPYNSLLIMYFSNAEIIKEQNKQINKTTTQKPNAKKVEFTKNDDGVPNFINF